MKTKQTIMMEVCVSVKWTEIKENYKENFQNVLVLWGFN